jgi:3-hydroxyisobutyrate dehydrogenase
MKIARVGFVGLGNMGGPMCAHLLGADFKVRAFDVDERALARAAAAGAQAASSAADAAAGAEALVTMLPGPPQVEQVLLGEARASAARGAESGGALAALPAGSVLIEMSTSSAALGERLRAAAAERGIGVLDAPVAGQAAGARAGTLSIYVGGERALLERCRPLLEAMGDRERIFHVGGPGCGYVVKLLLNLLWFAHAVAAAEALAVGVRAGVSVESLHAALIGSPANSHLLERDLLPVLQAGDYDEAFPLRLATKDLALAIELAREAGVPVELSALVEQIHRRARARFGEDAGELSAVRLYEELAAAPLRFGVRAAEEGEGSSRRD